jgi:hypothetical protein
MMLMDRAAPGDRGKAQTLLNEAQKSYECIGMPRHVEMTQTLLARAAVREGLHRSVWRSDWLKWS